MIYLEDDINSQDPIPPNSSFPHCRHIFLDWGKKKKVREEAGELDAAVSTWEESKRSSWRARDRIAQTSLGSRNKKYLCPWLLGKSPEDCKMLAIRCLRWKMSVYHVQCMKPEKQDHWDINVYIHMYRGIYYAEWTQMIVKAEKSHNLPSAGWRLRKDSDVNSSLTLKAWESRKPMVHIPVQGQEKRSIPAKEFRHREWIPFSTFLFYSDMP